MKKLIEREIEKHLNNIRTENEGKQDEKKNISIKIMGDIRAIFHSVPGCSPNKYLAAPRAPIKKS